MGTEMPNELVAHIEDKSIHIQRLARGLAVIWTDACTSFFLFLGP